MEIPTEWILLAIGGMGTAIVWLAKKQQQVTDELAEELRHSNDIMEKKIQKQYEKIDGQQAVIEIQQQEIDECNRDRKGIRMELDKLKEKKQ